VNFRNTQTGHRPLNSLAEIGKVDLIRLLFQKSRRTLDMCVRNNGVEGTFPTHLASQIGYSEVRSSIALGKSITLTCRHR